MASFTDSIKLTVDIITGQSSKSPFKSLRDDIDQADGGFNKLKAAGSSIFDSIQANAGAFALSAGAALVGFGIKAVSAMEDVALGAGELRDKLGLTAEAASRWQEVANDLGISNGTLETVIGRMNKTLGQTPDAFRKLGVEVAKTKDGSTDVSNTFLNVIERLHEIKDPAERAAAATKLLGKSWQDSAELINLGAAGVKARLADVESQKIVSDDQINASRQFRDSLRNLKDSAEDLGLSVGGVLLPPLAKLVELAAKIASPLAKGADEIAKFNAKTAELADQGQKQGASFWDQFVGGVAAMANNKRAGQFLKDTVGGLFQSDDVKASLADLNAPIDDVNSRFTTLIRTSAQAADAAKAVADAQAVERQSFTKTADTLKTWADRQSEALQATEEYNKVVKSMDWGGAALKGAVAGMSDFHAQFFALADIASNTEAAFDGLGESLKKNGKSFDLNTEKGRANQKAVEDLSASLDTQLSAALADSGGNLDTFKGKAATIADTLKSRLQKELGLSESAAQDMIQRLGLMPKDIETRYKLSGDEEAKLKLQLLQGSIDHLDKDVQTVVQQRIIQGDYQGALAAMQAGIDRHGPLTVSIQAAPTNAASSVLAQIRTPAHASGGTIGPNEPVSLVGERGPELVSLPAGSRVHTASETAGMLADSGGTAVVYNVTINAGIGANMADAGRLFVNEIKKYERTNGSGWRR
jgi:hypothetical protein